MNRWSRISVVIGILAIFIVSALHSKWGQTGSEATISWDVAGYYMYLPAGLIYNDFEELAFKDSIMQKYKPSSSFYQAFQVENGNWLLQYPSGLSVMYVPGFLIGHLGAKLGGYAQDGFSIPYQIGIWLWSLLVSFIGLILLRKLLLFYFSDKTVAVTLLALVLATNYFNYTAIDGALAHNYEFTLYAALLLFTRKWYLKPSYKLSIIIGLLVGLAALARPTDIVIAIVPLAWGLTSLRSIKSTFQFLIAQFPKLIVAGVVTLLIGSIQLLYWKLYSGEWIVYTYRDYGFSWRGQHLIDCFFSFKKGWLIYTPVMSFALIGFYYLYKKWEKLFWFSFLFFIVNTYIIFSWDIWWYGGSFGQRAMVESYAILALPFAAFFEMGLKSFLKYLIIPALIFCTWLNLFQTYQIHAEGGGMDPEYMTEAYYWRIFGNNNVKDSDRILMDTDEDFLGERKNVKKIFEEDFESFKDTTNVRVWWAYNSKMGVYLNFDYQKSPVMEISKDKIEGDWLRVNGHFYMEWKEWDVWQMHQLKIAFYDDQNKVVKERFIRLPRMLPEDEWTPLWMDVSVPDQSFETFKFWMENPGGRKYIVADDFFVESFDE